MIRELTLFVAAALAISGSAAFAGIVLHALRPDVAVSVVWLIWLSFWCHVASVSVFVSVLHLAEAVGVIVSWMRR